MAKECGAGYERQDSLFFVLILIASVVTAAVATEITLDLKVSSDSNTVNLVRGNWQNAAGLAYRVMIHDKP